MNRGPKHRGPLALDCHEGCRSISAVTLATSPAVGVELTD